MTVVNNITRSITSCGPPNQDYLYLVVDLKGNTLICSTNFTPDLHLASLRTFRISVTLISTEKYTFTANNVKNNTSENVSIYVCGSNTY